jgi:hypothetical protein
VEVCDDCGRAFDTSGYSIVAGGRRYDSIECALKAQESVRRRADTANLWIEAGRRRLGLGHPPSPPQLKGSSGRTDRS